MQDSYLEMLAGLGLDLGKYNLDELVPMGNRPLWARRYFPGLTSLTQGATYDSMHVGVGDQASELGYSSGTLTLAQTNLRKGGIIPLGEFFVVHGLSIGFNHDIAITDLDAFERCTLKWVEQAGTEGVGFGYIKNCPPVYRRALEFAGAPTATADLFSNAHNVGKVFMSKRPLVIIEGGSAETEQGTLRMKAHETFTPSADVQMDIWLLGTWFTKPRSGD